MADRPPQSLPVQPYRAAPLQLLRPPAAVAAMAEVLDLDLLEQERTAALVETQAQRARRLAATVRSALLVLRLAVRVALVLLGVAARLALLVLVERVVRAAPPQQSAEQQRRAAIP